MVSVFSPTNWEGEAEVGGAGDPLGSIPPLCPVLSPADPAEACLFSDKELFSLCLRRHKPKAGLSWEVHYQRTLQSCLHSSAALNLSLLREKANRHIDGWQTRGRGCSLPGVTEGEESCLSF